MKFAITFVSVVFFVSLGFTQTVYFNLSTEKESLIVNILNDACADSWCEGAVEINFKAVKYDESSNAYYVTAEIVHDEKNILSANSFSFQCAISDTSLLDTVVNSTDLYDTKTSDAEVKLLNLIDLCVDKNLKIASGSN